MYPSIRIKNLISVGFNDSRRRSRFESKDETRAELDLALSTRNNELFDIPEKESPFQTIYFILDDSTPVKDSIFVRCLLNIY